MAVPNTHQQERGSLMRSIIVAALAAAALTACAPVDTSAPTPVQPASPNKTGQTTTAKKTVPIKLTAKRATAARSVLSDGAALSCVRVTVTNQSKKNLEVNPLYFSLTDTGGTKRESSSALGDYEGQIDTTTLAPGENAKGLVCAKGHFTPKIVAMTNELLSEAARAEVS
jgi:Domain of unknown function (DUF4352)